MTYRHFILVERCQEEGLSVRVKLLELALEVLGELHEQLLFLVVGCVGFWGVGLRVTAGLEDREGWGWLAGRL